MASAAMSYKTGHRGSPIERVMRRVVGQPEGCWIWTGSRTEAGYGHLNVDHRFRPTHQITYEAMVGPSAGPIPEGSRRDRETCSAACRQRVSRSSRSVTSETGAAVVRHSDVSRAATSPRHDLAAIAADIPTPADAYGLARAYCEVRGGGFGVVFGVDVGRRNEPVGPVFAKPKTAVELADLFNARLVAA
jgi:hypothetical protein